MKQWRLEDSQRLNPDLASTCTLIYFLFQSCRFEIVDMTADENKKGKHFFESDLDLHLDCFDQIGELIKIHGLLFPIQNWGNEQGKGHPTQEFKFIWER